MNRTIKNFTIASLLFLGTIAQANAASDNRSFMNDDTSVQSSSRRTANPLSVRNILFTGLVAAATVNRATGFSSPAPKLPTCPNQWFSNLCDNINKQLAPVEKALFQDVQFIGKEFKKDAGIVANQTVSAINATEQWAKSTASKVETEIKKDIPLVKKAFWGIEQTAEKDFWAVEGAAVNESKVIGAALTTGWGEVVAESENLWGTVHGKLDSYVSSIKAEFKSLEDSLPASIQTIRTTLSKDLTAFETQVSKSYGDIKNLASSELQTLRDGASKELAILKGDVITAYNNVLALEKAESAKIGKFESYLGAAANDVLIKAIKDFDAALAAANAKLVDFETYAKLELCEHHKEAILSPVVVPFAAAVTSANVTNSKRNNRFSGNNQK